MNQRRQTTLCLAALVLAFAGRAPSAWAEEDAAAHRAKATFYEEKAKAEQSVIDDHRHMLLEQFNEQITPKQIVRRQNVHCEGLVREAEKLRDDFRDLARWHRMRAAELEGK